MSTAIMQAAAASLTLPEIERLARQAPTIPALAFSMVNDAWGLLAYRQALVLRKSAGRWGAQSFSGLVESGETTPYQNWLRRMAVHVEESVLSSPVDMQDSPAPLLLLVPDALPPELSQEWAQWWPQQAIHFILRDRSGNINGMAFYLFDESANVTRMASLNRLAEVWLHAWAMLSGTAKTRWIPARRTRWLIAAALIACMLIPVRQSVLASAEIISLDSVVLASPVEGVVQEVLVRPNQSVKADQPLVLMDDTTLRNRRDVLLKSVGSAQAELLATTQKSFESMQSRGEVAPLSGRVEERRAELAYIDEQLQRAVVTAPKAGITVFGDPNDWRGRPVGAGERIMLVANPANLGILVHVPVADAIAINTGSPVRMFLHVSPLSPLDAEVIETGYQALLSPENIASYRIRAKLTEKSDLLRIGLKGTAKLYGSRVALGYWVMRRPLATAREWLGL